LLPPRAFHRYYCSGNPDFPHVLRLVGRDAVLQAHVTAPWFQVAMSQVAAAEELRGCPCGTFIVRPRYSNPPTFGLSYVGGGPPGQPQRLHHRKIVIGRGGVRIQGSHREFPTLADLVMYCSTSTEEELGVRLHPTALSHSRRGSAADVASSLDGGSSNRGGSTAASSMASLGSEADGADAAARLRDPEGHRMGVMLRSKFLRAKDRAHRHFRVGFAVGSDQVW